MNKDHEQQPVSITPEMVARFLKLHPEFFCHYPELLEMMKMPQTENRNGNVVNFQHFAIHSLQQKIRDVRESVAHTVGNVRHAQQWHSQVQEAVIRLMRTMTLEHFFECICVDFPAIFSLDVVRLGLESESAGLYESYYPEDYYSGMVLVALGVTTEMFSHSSRIRLVANRKLDHLWINELFFHECGDLAISAAYMLLELPKTGREAVLAFGTRQPGRFQSGQGSEAFQFLAHAASIKLDQLLYDQAGIV